MNKKAKDELMYRCGDALYKICKRYCSIPMEGIPCYGQKMYQHGDTKTTPCEKCEINDLRTLAVKTMDSTDYQAKMRFEAVGAMAYISHLKEKYGEEWFKYLDESAKSKEANDGRK